MNKFLQMLLLTSIMVLSSVIVQAQSLSKLKKSALDYFYDEDYESALGNYEKLIIRDSLEPLNFYYAGICLIELGFNTRSIPYFEKAEKLKLSDIKLYYYLGHSNHLKHNFDVAIKNYEIYKLKLIETAAQDVIEINKIDNYIKQCNVGKLLSAKPLSFKIENLGSNVNSQYPEYIPLISTDEKTIIFTTRRPENEGGKKDPSDLLYFEDVYVSKKENGKWQPPLPIKGKINTPEHDACVSLNYKGNVLYLYKKDKKNKRELAGDIYYSELKNNAEGWTSPKALNDHINSPYWEPSVCVTINDSILYFSSNRPGGYGGLDLYKSVYINGDWGPAVNLGPDINTKEDEDAPFIHEDSKTLYFSSKGHHNMGGYDIFISTLKNGHWTVPENIGFPLNSSGDDIFFSWNKDLSVVYFSSHRDDSFGDKDLYMGTLTAIKQKNQIMTDAAKHDSTTISNFQQIISGKVYNRTNTNEPVVYLFNPKNHLIKIEPDSGKFFRYKSLPYDDHKIVFESPFIKDNASALALPDSNDTYNHKPLHKVFVYLLNPQNEVIKETTSDTNGYFSFKDLPPLDAYKLVLSKPEEQKSLNKNYIRSSVSAAAVINMGDTVHNGYVYYGQVNNGSYSPNSKIFIADSASSKPFTQPNKDGYFAFVKIPHLNFEVKLKDDGLLTLQSTRIPTDCCLFVPRHVIPKFKYGKLPADTNVISLNYVIHGKVISKTGKKPLHDISLLLIDNNGNVVDKVITDHEGRFRFVKLKPDHYYVLFEHYDPTLKAVLTEDKDDLNKQKKHVIKSSMSNALVHDHEISTVYHPNENIIHIFKDSLLELKSQNPEKKYTEFVLGYVLIKKTNGPAAIVHVYLLNRNNELIAIATTDKNGIFCFRDLPPANYKIAFPVNYPTVKAEIDYTLSDYDILSDKAIPEGKKNLIVYGKVDLNGKSTSLENTIYLIDDQGHIIKTISDKDGHFAFTRINNLNYSIIITPNRVPKLKIKPVVELNDSCLYVPKTTVAKFRYHRIEKKGNIKVPDYILYGKITAKTGTAPLKDISMLLIDHNGNIIDKTKTNEEGHFKFHRLQLNDHYVVFESQNPNLKAELRFPVDNNQLVLNSNRHYINFKTYFEYNSVELSDSSQLILDQVYQEVKNSNKGKLYIYTYADPIGSRQYNINLSLQRANRIKKYLIQKGLAVSKITIYPKGSANLMIYSADKNVNRLNRRAEFEVE